MAQRSGWRKVFADLFKKDVSREVQTPQHYFELARKCMEHVKKMTSPSAPSTMLQFNKEQCAHLAHELEEAVKLADACSTLLCNRSSQITGLADSTSSTTTTTTTTTTTLGIVKLLCRCAKEVETFIQSCRQESWIQSAMVLWNVSAHVSSLTFDLEFCKVLLRNYAVLKTATSWSELIELDVIDDQSEKINGIVARDQKALLLRLEALNPVNDDCQLVKLYLSRRLNQVLSGVVEPKVWEIDFSSLKQSLGTNSVLGNGPASMVLKSTWLGAEVAEKRFYGTDNPSFRNEVEILAGLAHPCILPLLGYATDERVDDNKSSIVMELMDGDLLFLMEQRRSQQNPFPFTTCEAVDMMHQTAEGMRYLHHNKVVHRDLKSRNILVKRRTNVDGTEYIRLKVADFGLSKTKERSISNSGHTPNTGTTRWMAPELCRRPEQSCGDLHNGTQLRYFFKVDVYSFGMVCYEILTGKIPFSSIGSLDEVKTTVLNGGRPKLPDDCLPDLKTLIDLCWAEDPEIRPSFAEICESLKRVKYLLMRGSRVTIDVLWIKHEEMKERERLQKEKEEKEAILREKQREKREAIALRYERERRVWREAMARQKLSNPEKAFSISNAVEHRRNDLGVGSTSEVAWRTWPPR